MPDSAYAIIKCGGKQYRVEEGTSFLVELLDGEVGSTVNLEPVLVRSNKIVFDPKDLEKLVVEATIVAHEKGPKLRVFKFKPKRGYKRRTGHRQKLTRLEVKSLPAGTAKTTAASKEGVKSGA